MQEMGISFLFTGTENDDLTVLHAIMSFDSMDVIKKFGLMRVLTETRREVGAVIESGDIIFVSDDNFTNYPAAFIKN